MRVSCVVLAVVAMVAGNTASRPLSELTPADFLIDHLPGLTTMPPFAMYSGFMPATEGTQLFFWFVECAQDPASAPVALWLNGGPGASSVAYGFWTEHGPFRLQDNHTVVPYDYSWNRLANMLYVEAPSGVGFSYSEDNAHYATNDSQTSLDNYEFLLNFFQVFTAFSKQEVYLTGESYGGHYIPQLAMRIIEGQTQDNGLFARTKGFLIGNPGINSDWYFNINEYAFQTFLWSHALLPQKAYLASVKACGWDSFLTNCSRDFTHPSVECRVANTHAYHYVPKTWDPYNVLAKTCHDNAAKRDMLVTSYTPGLASLRNRYGIQSDYNPCMNLITPKYMNRADVKQAIHANDPHVANRTWPNTPSDWHYGSETADIALLFPKFFVLAPHWSILVVSGDADAAVPFVGTQRWIECLAQPVRNDWRNWMLEGDVAGSVIDYDHISFATVKGCGHTIPSYCPEAGFAFWENYLTGIWS